MSLAGGATESRHIVLSPAESLHVQLTGPTDGKPVVLIPGLFGSAFGFRHVIPLLTEAGYRAIVVEPLAIGESSRPERADYSAAAQGSRIGAVLDSLGVRHALLVAHSAAASPVFRLAYSRPELVAGLLTLESGPAETVATAGFKHAMRFAPLIRILGVGVIRRKIRGELIAASGNPEWVTDDVVRGYTAAAAADLGGTLKAFRAMARASEPEALAPHLSEIHSPVLLLIGTAKHDSDVKPVEIEQMRLRLSSFAVDSVIGAGHYLQEETPEAVLEALERLHHLVMNSGVSATETDPS
jgi:pimeloyl-ACP methyl ester carboxylesterase